MLSGGFKIPFEAPACGETALPPKEVNPILGFETTSNQISSSKRLAG